MEVLKRTTMLVPMRKKMHHQIGADNKLSANIKTHEEGTTAFWYFFIKSLFEPFSLWHRAKK